MEGRKSKREVKYKKFTVKLASISPYLVPHRTLPLALYYDAGSLT
jgi:hypothetical protein